MAFWDKLSSRGNVEDRRGSRSALALGGGGLGLGGLILVLALNFLNGGDVTDVLSTLENVQVAPQNINTQQFEGADSYEVFASTVLGSTNDVWTDYFNKNNRNYQPPKLVLFRNYTQSKCGGAETTVGPHYCPNDQTIYLDETFFDELKAVLKADGGDVAQAYVIAHEVGHHVQSLLGILDQVYSSEGTAAQDLAIKSELQADCFAGVWAYSIKDKGVFEQNEITEALNAAAAVGDDHVQATLEGRVTPENWTHGSSEQRVAWFTKGYNSGQPATCDTF